MVLPVIRHGAIFHRPSRTGKFHGVIAPTTPSGVWCTSTVWSSVSSMTSTGSPLGDLAHPEDRGVDLGGAMV